MISKALKKLMDTTWSKRVLERDFYRCQWCFRAGTDPHHIIYKSQSQATRWDIDNGICLCRECHDEAHKNPERFRRDMMRNMGIKYNELQEKAKLIVHYKKPDLLEILKKLKGAG